ncbi:MAG: hypothetical protein F4Z08_11395 [Chloroflexi bacterium]|nr:hypothetical protein [Chloroflexota bacterium]
MFDGYEWSSFVAWGLFLVGAVATIWAEPRLGAKRFSLQTVAAPFIAAALVPLLAQPHLTWLGAFTGGTVIAAGLVTAWGPEVNERVLLRRQKHHLYTQPMAISALSRSRHRKHVGRVLVALGIALTGGSASYAAIFIAFFLADGFSAVRAERRLRASGEHTRMVQLLWDSSTTLYLLTIVLIAGSTGAVLDGSLTWVEPGSTIQDSAPLLQALLATTIAVAAIGATATGIALQIRSAGFGGEIALAVVPRRRLLAAFPLVSLAALLTVVLLGRWSTLHNEFWGLLPSISVQLSILATVYVLWVTFKSVSSLTRNEPLVAFVGTSVLVADWPEQVRMYGWNAGRGRQLPNSLRVMERSLLGAMRQSDVSLFDALVYGWTFNARTQPVIAELDRPAGNPQQRRTALLDTPLAWDKAAFFEGLDTGLSHLSSALAARPDFKEYLARLAPMLDTVYPAIDPEQPFHPGLFGSAPPGFRFLRSITVYAANSEDRRLVRWLLSAHWSNRIELAIAWAERAWPTEDDDLFDTLDYAEAAFKSVATFAEPGPTGSDEDRDAVVWAVLTGLEVASHRGTISAGLSVIDAMKPYHDAGWPWRFERMATLTRKPSAPIGWMMTMIERSVDGMIEVDTDRSWNSRHDFRQIGEWWVAVVAAIPSRTHTHDEFTEDRFKEELQGRGVDVLTRLVLHLLDSEPEFASDTGLGQRGVIGDLLRFLSDAPPATQDSIIAFVRRWAQDDAARSWAAEACDRYIAERDSADA